MRKNYSPTRIRKQIFLLHVLNVIIWVCGILIGIAVYSTLAHGHDLPPHSSIPGVVHNTEAVLGTADYKHGPIVNDLMNRIPDEPNIYKTLKSRLVDHKDVGNWVHEATHFLNRCYTNTVRQHSKAPQAWGFYTLGGYGTAFRSPNVTLGQVAAQWHSEKTPFYQSYLVEARPHYNNDPLFLLDECVAVGNTMAWVNANKLKDEWRAGLLIEAAYAGEALVDAIKKFDPTYPDLDRLTLWVEWHNQRLAHLYFDHMDNNDP